MEKGKRKKPEAENQRGGSQRRLFQPPSVKDVPNVDLQCHSRGNPNGILSQSPRLPQRGYLGSSSNKHQNRNAVAAKPFIRLARTLATTPLGLFPICPVHPT
jgi:hypothetical protein